MEYEILKKAKELFGIWNNQILYCHWKSNEHLFEGLVGETDLDVLVSESYKQKANHALKICGFVQCKPQIGSYYKDVEDWIGLDDTTGKLIHIHLHYKIITGHIGMKEFTLPWETEILENRLIDKKTGVYIANPNHELVILYIRTVLKLKWKEMYLIKKGRYCLPEDIRREINYLFDKVNYEKLRGIFKNWFGDTGTLLADLIIENSYSNSNIYKFYKILKSHEIFKSGLINELKRVYFYLLINVRYKARVHMKILLRIRKSPVMPGISIAFIGQDGSGKSSVSQDILKWLSWKIDSEHFYLGSGDHYNTVLKKVAEMLVSKRQKNPVLFFPSKLVSMLFQLSISKNALKTLKKAENYRKHGGICLFDRYPQNQFCGIYDGPRICTLKNGNGRFLNLIIKKFARLEKHYFKQIQKYPPALVFKLILSAEESYRRKPDHDKNDILKKEKITQELIFKDSYVININANQSYNDELVNIKNIIWRYIVEKNREFNI